MLARFATGVTVVSAWRERDQPDAVTVSAFSALSLSPPLVLACIGIESDCYELLQRCDAFGVSILHEEQGELAMAFAELGEDKREALARHGQLWGDPGLPAPLLRHCAARLWCQREQAIVLGDHALIVGAVQQAEIVSERTPLVYLQGGFRTLAGF